MSSGFNIGTFLFRLVGRFAMSSVWNDFRAQLPVRCSLYGRVKINIKEILRVDEADLPLILLRFSADRPMARTERNSIGRI